MPAWGQPRRLSQLIQFSFLRQFTSKIISPSRGTVPAPQATVAKGGMIDELTGLASVRAPDQPPAKDQTAWKCALHTPH